MIFPKANRFLSNSFSIWARCLIFFFAFSVPVFGQSSIVPTVSFALDFPKSEPEHYVIRAGADCKASYESNGKLSADSEADTFRLEFTLSAPNCAEILRLTKQADFFVKKLDSGAKNLASTGTKVLAYENGTQTNQQSFNYSRVEAVQKLTSLFQNLSTTLEFGHRLEYFHHYQKLALSQELTRMEEMAQRDDLTELAAVSQILEQIANDATVINPVRARAQRLLRTSAAAVTK